MSMLILNMSFLGRKSRIFKKYCNNNKNLIGYHTAGQKLSMMSFLALTGLDFEKILIP